MKIGIISDTHNKQDNLISALETLRREGVSLICHCGDLTDPDMINPLHGFQVIILLGNVDTASGLIREALLEQNPDNWAGLVYSGKIGDRRIAATHGHIKGKVNELAQSGDYDFVFHGHTHCSRDVKIGGTRVINPGALNCAGGDDCSFCILDLETEEANFVFIKA